jgi:transcriptional regulator with XRE-family HTH domain
MENGLDSWRQRLVIALQNGRRRGITQEVVAAKLGVRQSAISNWKRGAREPSLAQIKQLAEALEVPAEWLLFGDVTRLSPDERDLLADYRAVEDKKRDTIRTVAHQLKGDDPANDPKDGDGKKKGGHSGN